MAKANKKAATKSAKAAAPKKGGSSAKAAAPKKGMKSAKAAAPKKGMKSAKAAAPKKGMKAASKSGKAAAPKKGMNSMKSAKASRPKASRVASSPMDQMTMLQNLFVDHLKDIYWAEKAAIKAMPRMRKAATTPELQQAFEQHLQVTTGQIARLDQVFELMGKKAQGKKCDAMEGLIKETESVITETEKGSKTRDVGLIIAAQKMEHYEIASYGGLAQLAKTMRLEEVKNLLGQTLEEEKQTDELLTQIAENSINIQAEEEGEESGSSEADEEGEGGGLDKVADETDEDAGDED